MELSDKIFNEKNKHSLIDILRNIDNVYIITFYTAFKSVFNEEDNVIQEIFEKQKQLIEDNDWDVSNIAWERYSSGFSPLQKIVEENNEWKWLKEQMKNGKVKEAFCFRDCDKWKSDTESWGNRYHPVNVYLTLSEKENILHHKIILISMYAMDVEKSVYRFEVKPDKMNEALFYIWSYFSSNNYNKRLDFHRIRYLMFDFGIDYFYKTESLNYNYENGYYENEIECKNKYSMKFKILPTSSFVIKL